MSMKQSKDIATLLLAIKAVVEAVDWAPGAQTWTARKREIVKAATDMGYSSELQEFNAWFQEEPGELDEAEESD